jgi:hypothetical protein
MTKSLQELAVDYDEHLRSGKGIIESVPKPEPFDEVAFTTSRESWLGHSFTEEFMHELEMQSQKMIADAKDLAALDESRSSSKIRALLLESKTLDKVIAYGRRNKHDDKY